jgi:intracellular septation protein|tara:strand:- start:167 stop:700 length:534 start_codon:yes stop_codon:yes gene_type:complete
MKIFAFFIEVFPLVGFFIGFHYYGIYIAAVISVFLGLIVLFLSWFKDKRLAPFPLYCILFSAIFTLAAILFDASIFIKIQPTVTNGLFSLVLLGGWFFDKPMMQIFFGSQFNLNNETWIKLTYRWGCFFFILAVTNEIVWRNNSEIIWVNYKTFFVAPVSILFMLAQLPLTIRGTKK